MALDTDPRFWRHALHYLRSSRWMWGERERMHTIHTVYEIEPSVRQHYAHIRDATEIPTLSRLFPVEPYTKVDAVEARSHGHTVNIQQTMPTCTRPVLQPENPVVQLGNPPSSGSAIPNGVPYKHWPSLPWPLEPTLPDIGASIVSEENQNKFMNIKPHLSEQETRWQGAKFLGNGSYAAVGLWCEIDEYGNIVDRMVVKDNASATLEAWRDPKNWRDGLPRELAITQRIEARREAEPEEFQYINRFRGHRLLMSARRFRLYADFASGGNLFDALWPYHLRWNKVEHKESLPQVHVPEAFIWYIVKALATALLLLQNGTLGNDKSADWKPIMHLDMQTSNVLLDVRAKKRASSTDDDSETAPAGPNKRQKVVSTSDTHEIREIVPQLADFGLSFFDLDFSHCPELDENPYAHVLHAQDSRYAPEHNFLDISNPKRLDERTDVWGIGRIAWALIVNRQPPHGPLREGGHVDERTGDFIALSRWQDYNKQFNDRYDREVLVGTGKWAAALKYSDDLRDLVRDCLRFDKEFRPSPSDVLDRVNKHLETTPALVARMTDPDTLLELADNDGFRVGQLLIVPSHDEVDG